MRSRPVLVFLVTSLFVLGACSSDGSDGEAAPTTTTTTTAVTTTTTTPDPDLVDATTWAEGVCGSYEVWVAEMAADFAGDGPDEDPEDVEGGKAKLSEVFGIASLQTRALIVSVEDAGTPDVPDGDELAADLVDALETIDAAALETQEEVRRLDSPDPESFASAKELLTSRFRSEVDRAAELLSALDEDYPSRELDVAITASCDF